MAIGKKDTTPFGSFKESAGEIWLAGLGAFASAGEEGARFFQGLVEKGREFEVEHEGGRLARVTERAGELKEDARNVLSRVTTPLEDGVSATLERLGIPSRAEIVKLTQRVEELTRQVAKAKAASEPAPRARAASPAKARPKPKPAPRKPEKAAPAVTV